MASANPGIIQYSDKPRCPICLSKFNTPRQLTCLHSFCQCCLEDYILSKAEKVMELKQFECPICRAVILVPRKGKTSKMWASLFPINSILQSIGGEEKDEVDILCDCCMSDGVSVTANGFCIVCEEAMCTSCIKVHQKQKVSKDHSIVTIDELTNNPKNFIRFDKGFRCQEHEEEELKFYCKDHKITCCSSCCIVHHRNCAQVLDLRKDANNLLKDIKPLHILDEMTKIENLLRNIEKNNDSNVVSLESQVQEMTNRIKEIRKTINDLLDDLERNVKSEGFKLYKQEAIRKQEQNHDCQALLNAVRNSHVTLETVMKHGSDKQIFLMADITIQQVKLYHERIKEKIDETETVRLELEIDPQIQCFLSQMSGIGRVICKKELDKLLKSRVEKPLKECKLEMTKAVGIKGPDGKNPWYTGFTFLQEDQVLLADYNNKRVVLLNTSYQCIVSLTLPDKPWGICVLDHREVAVSLPLQKTLQFLNVRNGFMRPTRTVDTRYECRGIASNGRGKIVLSGSCKDRGKHYWSLVNSTGVEEKCYQFDCQCDPSLTYVALNSLCTRVYISVSQAHSLYCFDMDGKRLFIYRNYSLKFSLGVAIDRDDNVYVLGMLSYNIHQLTPSGSPIRIYTDRIPEFPYAICFNSSRDTFALTNNSGKDDGKKLYIYKFK